ncbi:MULTISPECIES: HAD-IA family hydrolase [unclassified Rhizobacter]|uniref:HAD-IA family hydrolase n=1 Tax=unclassified Rhizobacter TaxID=2640088 RepID=UPI0006FFF800|nr:MULTISPECIES: HAD-IA family hydrolase [unclassified Rhizobacter]KQU77164.1 haloacid dehalogenase [Rhizobacter sp. Root29]KQW12762.1 haloacid dehalogenase [Rhizobacter sp. Root1238]KRB22350.1 haloacid dehalogenase [Rhizobacter sp. Root16D2]
MSVEALIFDVDGTLADTEEAHRIAFNGAFDQHRLGWTWTRADYRQLLEVAGGKERIASYIASLPLGPGERQRLLALVPQLHADKTRLYGEVVNAGGVPLRDGVERLLNEALEQGCHLAIASTTTAANINALLNATLGPRGLDLFAVIACGDQVRAKKPAPDIYRLALDTLGLPPEQALAVEDSAHGLRAATAAGLWTLVTPTFWTQDGDFRAAGLLLPDLGDLGFDELVRIARPARPASPVQALYRETTR